MKSSFWNYSGVKISVPSKIDLYKKSITENKAYKHVGALYQVI